MPLTRLKYVRLSHAYVNSNSSIDLLYVLTWIAPIIIMIARRPVSVLFEYPDWIKLEAGLTDRRSNVDI